MATPRLSKLELKIMETLWTKGDCSSGRFRSRFLQESSRIHDHTDDGNADGTKKIVNRVKKIGTSHIFGAACPGAPRSAG